jgi:hypothetical protein
MYIYYNIDGWICERYPYLFDKSTSVGSLEVNEEEYNKTLISNAYYAWRIVDGKLVNEQYEEKIWTVEERLQERINLHSATDDDYLKYARNVRNNVDLEYSELCCQYIDNFNLQVSDTVNQEGYPQTVSYPVYNLPERT